MSPLTPASGIIVQIFVEPDDNNLSLREDDSVELREEGGAELRE